jgi:hypothetical protein
LPTALLTGQIFSASFGHGNSPAMLVGDSFTSSANGTCGLQARHDSDGISEAHRGEPTRQEIGQSISLGRVLQRFV